MDVSNTIAKTQASENELLQYKERRNKRRNYLTITILTSKKCYNGNPTVRKT